MRSAEENKSRSCEADKTNTSGINSFCLLGCRTVWHLRWLTASLRVITLHETGFYTCIKSQDSFAMIISFVSEIFGIA